MREKITELSSLVDKLSQEKNSLLDYVEEMNSKSPKPDFKQENKQLKELVEELKYADALNHQKILEGEDQYKDLKLIKEQLEKGTKQMREKYEELRQKYDQKC